MAHAQWALMHRFPQGKLQRDLLLCIKLCHAVIQAALFQFCNTKLLSNTNETL